jgi:hypothetical protein
MAKKKETKYATVTAGKHPHMTRGQKGDLLLFPNSEKSDWTGLHGGVKEAGWHEGIEEGLGGSHQSINRSLKQSKKGVKKGLK